MNKIQKYIKDHPEGGTLKVGQGVVSWGAKVKKKLKPIKIITTRYFNHKQSYGK